ncbi:ectomycorrhizas-regulated small secreted protein [Ephemerocybe angulata]|uniref:Ectomycorrhizas-regulated small secreted protein n=1 Tax=Ephemerocybe angulata TaxID=980116 RepID=A0A8H6LTK3_9AGAR|nr:ectomycorrhizas-regulated small secreted protein [Tulosesus angulatus]
MRLLLLSFIPLLLQVATAYYDDSDFYAREYPDSLSTRSDALTHLSTRELLDELSTRLERRAGGSPKNDKDKKDKPEETFVCGVCRRVFPKANQKDHVKACEEIAAQKAGFIWEKGGGFHY